MIGSVVYLVYLVIVSLVTFVVWGWDKSAAIRGAWRTPERVLLLLVFLGGAIGAGLGMVVFRHKTRDNVFRLAVPAAAILQIGLLVLI